MEPPEAESETESESDSDLSLPNRVSRFEADIFEQVTKRSYDGEILSGTDLALSH